MHLLAIRAARSAATLLVAVTVASCAASVGPDPDTDASVALDDGAVVSLTTRLGDGGFAVCLEQPEGETVARSLDEFDQMVMGRWALCHGRAPFGGSAAAGIEIADDGHWYALYASDDGGAGRTRGHGFSDEGLWQTLATGANAGLPGGYQLNLTLSGGGTFVELPGFARSPRAMHFEDEGVGGSDYFAVP